MRFLTKRALLLALLAAVAAATALGMRQGNRTGPAASGECQPTPGTTRSDRLPAPRPQSQSAAPSAPETAPLALSAPDSTIVVTYFHSRSRCLSCVRLERLTETTVTTRFARQVREQRVLWRRMDVDEPHQEHFVRDYGLQTKSVVVSEVSGGFEVRWKNLDRVWQLLEDPEAFKTYVEQEVRGFLRQG